MQWISLITGLRLPGCRYFTLSAVAVGCLLVGCVDTTPPWDKVKVAASGGNADTSAAGGAAIDGLAAAGGSGGGAMDVGGPGGGDAIGSGGAIDAPAGGAAGGMDAGLGGAGGLDGGPGIDVSPPGTGGASGSLDAQTDGRLTGSGGIAGAGGNPGTGGAAGHGGAGGKTGRGGSGGTTARDAGADLVPDLAPDLAPDLTPDFAPDLTPDTSTLGTGLVAYYRFESASGTELADSSGHAYTGTLSVGLPPDGGTAPSGSSYSFATGKVGNALVLAKAGYGYVSLPPAVFAGITDFTIAVWVNVTTTQNWQRVFDVGIDAKQFDAPTTGAKYMNLTPRNSRDPAALRFSITSNGMSGEESLNTTPLATGVWKHVAVVLTGGNGWLYVDGEQAVTDPTALTPAGLGAIDYAYLGKSQFGADPYFDGMLDELRVYNRALSAAEIKAVFQLTGP